MTPFILLAVLLTLAVLAVLGWTVWRTHAALPASAGSALDNELNIVQAELALLRQQRQELEQDLATGKVSSSDHEATLNELSARASTLLQDQQRLGQGGVANARVSKAAPAWLLIVLGLAIPMLALGLYLKLGTPEVLVAQAGNKANTVEVDGQQISIKELVARLEQKLNEQPDQAEGWVLLGHTKYKLGDYAGAASALRRGLKALEKSPQANPDLQTARPDILADLADAQVMQRQGAFSADTQALVQEALKLNPQHPKSLALAAGAAMRANNKPEALGYWQRLRATLPANAPELAELDGVIADLGGRASVQAQAQAQAQASATPVAKIRITGSVSLAAALKDKVQAGDTLFVYARRTGANAPRMPLAVARFTLSGASALPQKFELTEAMAMAPGMSLMDTSEAEITARISRSGHAITASGDLNSAPLIVKPQASPQGLQLVIDHIVP